MNRGKDKKAIELVRDFLEHHDREVGVGVGVGTEVAVSGERLLRVRIVRKPPAWIEFLRELLERGTRV